MIDQPTVVPSKELVVPGTGELVDLSQPDQAARALNTVKNLQAALNDARRTLEAVVLEEGERQGSRRITFPDGTLAEITKPTDLVWDIEILRELEAAGLPPERMGALLRDTVETKVSAKVANELERNSPVYAEIIGRARQRVPKRPTVDVDVPKPKEAG